MAGLELRVPPPFVALVTGAAMGAAARVATAVALPDPARLGAVGVLLVAALGFGGAAIVAFRRAGTTVDPTKPEKTSRLVTSGVYRVSRNPMYLALTLGLFAWATWLSVPWCALGPLAFALFLGRFQIAPEERVMAEKFGRVFDEYRSQTRRWL